MATRTEFALPEAQIERIEHADGTVRVHLRQFYSFVSLTGSSEQTQWRQAGVLVLEGVELEEELPAGEALLVGGDIHDNAYTYRDRVPLPLDARGHVGLTLRFEGQGQPMSLWGSKLRLELVGERRYVTHVR